MTYLLVIVTLLIFLCLPVIFFGWLLYNNKIMTSLHEKIVKILNKVGEKW